MTNDANDDSKPQKNRFRLDLGPSVVVETSIGPVFLYDPGDRTISAYAKRDNDEAGKDIRWFLSHVATKIERKHWKDVIVPLGEEVVRAFSDDDIERLSEQYLGTRNSQYFIAKAKKSGQRNVRREAESAVSYLNRLLRFGAKYERDELNRMAGVFGTKALIERTYGQSISALHELQRQASTLSTIAEEARRNESVIETIRKTQLSDRLSQQASSLREMHMAAEAANGAIGIDWAASAATPQTLTIESTQSPYAAMRRAEEMRRKERDEELALAREVRGMTTRSAEHLAQLTQTTTTMLEQFGVFLGEFAESSRRADRGGRLAIWIATGSIIVSVVLTLMSYLQDFHNNRSTDMWQAATAKTLETQLRVSERSLGTLLMENAQLAKRIQVLEKASDAGTPKFSGMGPARSNVKETSNGQQ